MGNLGLSRFELHSRTFHVGAAPSMSVARMRMLHRCGEVPLAVW